MMSCCLGDLPAGGVDRPIAAAAATLSSPRDSRSISAPKWWSAVMVEGVGSGMLESGSHSSCVSSVVSSVSVEAAEWASWPRCCGVEQDAADEDFPAGEESNSRRHVHLRSIPEGHSKRGFGIVHSLET
jgi:hypothetical protein